MIKNDFGKLLRESIDDERMFRVDFPTQQIGTLAEPRSEILKELLEDEAERLEQTVDCVATVVSDDRNKISPLHYEQVCLFILLPRHADTQLVNRVLEEIRHRVLTEAAERQQEARRSDE